MYLVIIILLLTVISMLIYKFFSYEYLVLNVLSKMKYGNIKFVHEDQIIFSLVNMDGKKVAIINIFDRYKFFKNLYKHGEAGLGKSYIKKYWNTDDLLECLTVLALNEQYLSVPNILRFNTSDHKVSDDHKKIKHHYDVGNDFYDKILLDELSAYSCGFWYDSNDTLNNAQFRKVDTIIQKINPKPGSSILDIGCGWAKIANYVARQTECKVDGVTLSDEQMKYGNKNSTKDVNIFKMHYTQLNKKYDHIYSIGMFEHVRHENYDQFFESIHKLLKPNGRFLLHTIIDTKPKDPQYIDKSFISQYIFPGGQVPNSDWIISHIEKNGLSLIHAEIYGGQHYARTLHEWNKNMQKNKEYIYEHYGEALYRQYEYYFNICEAGFTTGKLALGHYLITNTMRNTLDNNYL